MAFEFSSEDRNITVHHFDDNRVYVRSEELLIEANTGLPACSTTEKPPVTDDSHVVVYDAVNEEWLIKPDFRGQEAYAISGVISENYTVIDVGELPQTHTLLKPNKYDVWNEASKCWEYSQEKERPTKEMQERLWRDGELTKVLSRIDQYEKDQSYPEEYRTSPIKSHDDFLLLLNDRKELSDYPNTMEFPFGERPVLSQTIQHIN
ncbi:hypothetical protein L1D15_09965 [Vibrio sp. Isolate25]|uniref:hypothetical protein n=1 Tax=Vibrio sp. Isolate25 TaxID=2908535 RepID=UPI001EFC3ABB|nr:hypothetical protein [Vibrio sp. Isolate25]MCG9597051.1 hypothetical protein [Vibrio sp. Isolate25]